MREIGKISETLDDVNARLGEWRRGVSRDYWAAGGHSAFELYQEMHRRASAGEGPQAELFSFLDALCESYLHAGAEQCSAIRHLIHQHQEVLTCLYLYINRTVERLRETGDRRWLGRGLAAASLEDGVVNYDDFRALVGRLYDEANVAGLDPQPTFAAVAEVSSSAVFTRVTSSEQLLEGKPSTRTFLERYCTSRAAGDWPG